MDNSARQLRARAQQARRLAREFAGDKAVCDMLALAVELEHRADAIDAMDEPRFRRVIYQSAACPGVGTRDLDKILVQSRVNNGLDGLSGLLWSDGLRFTQLLEGSPEGVTATFARIIADRRHKQIQVISDDMVEERAFGDWSMAHLPEERGVAFEERMKVMLAGAPPHVRAVFAPLT